MAFTTPYTFIALQALTAAQMNGIQANISALFPYTAQGDLAYASAANALDGLAKGTAGQVLKMNASETAPEWGSPSGQGCHLYRTSVQTIPNATETDLLFDAEYFDDNSFHSNTTNIGRITIPSGGDGRYLFGAHSYWAVAGDQIRMLRINKNGTAIMGQSNTINVGSSSISYICISGITSLVAGDYLTASVFHGDGANLDVSNNPPAQFWVMKV